MAQLTRDEVHTYAKAMIAAIKTPAFQARVRAAMSREPTPADAEAVMERYEEVQADYFTNHYNAEADDVCSGISAGEGNGDTSSAGGTSASTQEASETLAKQVSNMSLDRASDVPTLDGVHIVEQLKNAVCVYKEAETVRLITQLCLLIESQVTVLPATVPALQHLYNNSGHGAPTLQQLQGASTQAGDGHNALPGMNPSPQVRQMMEMAMRTLSPKQRETLERVQRAMLNGSPPSPEDTRDMLLIQRQLGAFMQTIQRFAPTPNGRGRGGGGGQGA
ncbi:conserved hypothetical protein [Leishmania braziliensis MHOM/BR/75/M2904]|uniref:Uncharacterized protein n=2 Tax=Leishmania braziliensis TaxID=5660 RepID=A4H5B5_LEIBR|nr:conserved hypothetical protein [Leishmania braziliensis MHOM/BR/75/M2904]CAJ2467191.1 unnamed protein product [Leishmania braziliensis]CAM37139.1 conserved hypothetical protein [Leishmania braziliensis MHOM/BR/75/M2904]SYZ63140.1 hypothetical_protein [Leishmania braziliensis MHOM/BR/75/M2904]